MSIFTIQDILQIIFNYCPITDKRNFIRTCIFCYKLSVHMPVIEKYFQEMINSTRYLELKFTNFDISLYKYTIELVYDGYTYLFPDRYLIPENGVLYYCYKIYYQIAKTGNLNMLKLILSKLPYRSGIINRITRGAAKGGHKFILEWLKENNYVINSHCAAEYATRGNHFELLKWLYELSIVLPNKAHVVKTNNMEIIKWFFEKDGSIDEDCIYYAVKNNNMDLVEWFYQKDPNLLLVICECAIEEGKLEILKWASSHCVLFRTKHYSCLTYGGHIEILEWLKENNYMIEKSEELSKNAAFANNFETLKWAYENSFSISPFVCEGAALNGNIEMLEWCKRKVGSEITNEVAKRAIESGNLETLKWILKNGAQMNDKLCAEAALYGEFDVLQWLYENGCPWTSKTCENAASMAHFSILKWAYEKGCPLNMKCCNIKISCCGHVEILKWLGEKGYNNNLYGIAWSKEPE